jgi:hypothetical protein
MEDRLNTRPLCRAPQTEDMRPWPTSGPRVITYFVSSRRQYSAYTVRPTKIGLHDLLSIN